MNPVLGPPVHASYGGSLYEDQRQNFHKQGPLMVRTEGTKSCEFEGRAIWKPLYGVLAEVWLLLRPIVDDTNIINSERKIKVCGVQNLSMMPPSSPSEVIRTTMHFACFCESKCPIPKAECEFELLVSRTDAINYYQLGRWETGGRQDASEYWVVRVRKTSDLDASYPLNRYEQARDRKERDEWISALKSAQKQHAIRNQRELIAQRTDEDLHAVQR